MEAENQSEFEANSHDLLHVCSTREIINEYAEYAEKLLDDASISVDHYRVFTSNTDEFTKSGNISEAEKQQKYANIVLQELHSESKEYCTARLGQLILGAIENSETDPEFASAMAVKQLTDKEELIEIFDLVDEIRLSLAKYLDVDVNLCKSPTHRVVIALRKHLEGFTPCQS